MNKILIKNGKVLLLKNENIVIENKDILIENGKIVKIERNIQDNADKVIDAQNHIVMPGLINTHAHIPMSIFRETTEGCKLYEWLNDKIWPAVNTGVRAVITRPIVDMGGDLQTRINEFREFYESRDENNALITYSVAPHSLYTCSDKALEACTSLAKEYNLPIHVHFLESIDEIEDIKNKHGRPAIQVLRDYFKDVHTILAHCVKLTDEDIEVLKTMDCGIAHNPISNLRLGCKIADTTKYLKQGLNVALGTDGQGSGSNMDMFEAMRVACLAQGGIHENEERITAKDAVKMATINGAKLLQLDNKIGSIEVGKDADIILVNIEEKLDNITMLPNLNKIANLVYNTSGRSVDTTIVKGNILMENRQIKNVDVNEVIMKCNKILERHLS